MCDVCSFYISVVCWVVKEYVNFGTFFSGNKQFANFSSFLSARHPLDRYLIVDVNGLRNQIVVSSIFFYCNTLTFVIFRILFSFFLLIYKNKNDHMKCYWIYFKEYFHRFFITFINI